MNPTKHALLAELTRALAPLLPPDLLAHADLPKPVAHALEQLAESLLLEGATSKPAALGQPFARLTPKRPSWQICCRDACSREPMGRVTSFPCSLIR